MVCKGYKLFVRCTNYFVTSTKRKFARLDAKNFAENTNSFAFQQLQRTLFNIQIYLHNTLFLKNFIIAMKTLKFTVYNVHQ